MGVDVQLSGVWVRWVRAHGGWRAGLSQRSGSPCPTAEQAGQLPLLVHSRGITASGRSPRFAAFRDGIGNVIWVRLASKPLSLPSYRFFFAVLKKKV